uniref:Uncharacterized protein n=1 Tax=uncultured virus TaxID=340016 RepID=D5L2P2_9VIRU|nr:hypothetical protein [uncultured virus]
MTRRTIENKIEDLEQSVNRDNGLTIVPLDESGEVRGDSSIENSADMLVTISVSDETYATW